MSDETAADVALDRYSVPGHDRDCLRAMRAQAKHGINPLSRVQVDHLLNIAWTAGATAEHDAMHEGITEDCRQMFDYAKALAQTGHSGTRFVESIARVFGPTLSWRRRVRLAAYLAFRRGYPPRAEGGVS
jgi:hypothetical protein